MAAGDAAMQQLAQAFSALGYNAKASAASLKNLMIPANFSKSVKGITTALTQMGASIAPLAGAISKFMKALANLDAFSSLKNAVKTTVTSMAMAPVAGFQLLSGALDGLIGMIEKFVSSLNPAIVEQLQLAFDDLFAVVGRLFVPIMAAVVPIVRTFADALVPVIQSMLPAFQLFADALINIATPVIGIFSGLLQMLQPYLEEFAGMVAKIASTIGEGLLPIVEAMIPYWEALAEIVLMLMEPLNELVKALMSLAVPILNLIVPPLVAGLKLLADIVVWVVKKFAWLIGTIAGFANDLVGGGGKRLKIPQVTPGASRGMAAKGAQFTGFAEFGQQIMAASFGSSVNTPEFKTAENTAKIADGIQTLVRQGENQAPAIPIGQGARGKF